MLLDIGVCLGIVQLAIAYYDYLLTLDGEIELFWKKSRRSWPFAFFVANRYVLVLGRLPTVASLFWKLSENLYYNLLMLYYEVIIIVGQVIVAVLMIIRVYALYSQSRPILILLVVLLLIAIVIAAWAVSSYLPTTSAAGSISNNILECPHSLSLSSKQAVYVAVAWSGQLVFDVVVFVLTLWRSYYLRTPGGGTIANVFLRDGSMYFGMLAAANGVNIIVLLVSESDCFKGSTGGCANVLSATMMSRLMLNLRDTGRTTPENRLFSERSSTLAFAENQGGAEIELGTML